MIVQQSKSGKKIFNGNSKLLINIINNMPITVSRNRNRLTSPYIFSDLIKRKIML